MKGSYSISELCDALDVSRSGYHAACARGPAPRTQANAQLLGRMQAIHSHRHTRGYGSPRMTRELQDTGSACSVNRVARVMRVAGLRVIAIYTRVSTTTQSTDSQLEELRDYCHQRGWQYVQEFTDCVSGGTQNRAGLDRLMELVRLGKVSVVVAYKLDRHRGRRLSR